MGSKESKILILSTERGWGWGGSKAIVTLPSNYYNPSDDINCYFDKENKNIEYIQWKKTYNTFVLRYKEVKKIICINKIYNLF